MLRFSWHSYKTFPGQLLKVKPKVNIPTVLPALSGIIVVQAATALSCYPP